MDAHSPLHSLPPGFHWEAPFAGSPLAHHLVAVPDSDPDAWLASVRPAVGERGAIATIRRHLGLKDQVSRPFRTDAAALGWVERWLAGHGATVRAELADERPSRRLSTA